MRRLFLLAALGLALGATLAIPAQAAPRDVAHEQVITVRVDSARSTSGILEAWKWSPGLGDYRRILGPVRAYVGTDGVGKASEYVSRTPAGVFTLTEAFGRSSDPGTQLPYRQVGYSDWWVSDVGSAKYNTFQHCSPGTWCGFDQGASEQLGAIGLYDYAVVIDYNRRPAVPGKGSAFFLHVTEYAPTQGCISIEESTLVRLLTWLKPARQPVISIGVGNAAYAPLR